MTNGKTLRLEPRELQERLAQHPFLLGLPAEHQGVLAEYATAVEFAEGQLIFHEGDLAHCCYLLYEGQVHLEAVRPGMPVQLIDELGPGEILGWSWLFPPFRLHFTARAQTPVKAIFIYGTWLRERIEQDPRLSGELLRRMASVAIRRLQTLQRLLAAEVAGHRPAGGN